MNRLLIILSTYMFIINIHAQDIDYQDYNVYDIINEISEDELSEIGRASCRERVYVLV